MECFVELIHLIQNTLVHGIYRRATCSVEFELYINTKGKNKTKIWKRDERRSYEDCRNDTK